MVKPVNFIKPLTPIDEIPLNTFFITEALHNKRAARKLEADILKLSKSANEAITNKAFDVAAYIKNYLAAIFKYQDKDELSKKLLEEAQSLQTLAIANQMEKRGLKIFAIFFRNAANQALRP